MQNQIVLMSAAVLMGVIWAGRTAKAQQQQDVEKLIARQRQLVQDRYEQEIGELEKSAQAAALKEFRYPRRILWEQFLKMLNQMPMENRYFLKSGFLEHKTHELRYAMMDSYSIYSLGTLLVDENARKIVAGLESNSNYSFLMRTQACKVLAVMDGLQSKLLGIERQRQYQLAQLEQTEKALRQDLCDSRDAVKTPLKTPERGVVGAIAYDLKGSFAMVDGQIVRQAETIDNVRIVKIYPDAVEFEKNGERWTQQLGQVQETFWK